MGASGASSRSLLAVLAMAAFTFPAMPETASAARPLPTAPCTVTGTGGADTLTGGPGDDVICGFGGDDDLSGGGGDDVIRGGPGADTIYGEAGDDYSYGGAGIDTIFGGADNDLLNGAADDDQVSGDAGDDDVRGGAGSDTLAGGDDNDIIRSRDGGTVDQVLCGLGADRAYIDQVDTFDAVNCEVTRVLDVVSPTAVDDDITVTEDDPAAAFNVRANDTDPDGGVRKIDTVTQPANGTVSISAGERRVIYQPNPNYCNDAPTNSTDDFTYTLKPGGSTATVHVTVICTDDGPMADDETFTGADAAIGNTVLVVDDPTDAAPAEAGPHKTVSGDLLDGDSDIDGPGPLAITAETVSTTDGGTAAIEADGDFVFTPAAGISCTDHTDSFDYTVNSGAALRHRHRDDRDRRLRLVRQERRGRGRHRRLEWTLRHHHRGRDRVGGRLHDLRLRRRRDQQRLRRRRAGAQGQPVADR